MNFGVHARQDRPQSGMDKYRHVKKIGEGAFGKALLVQGKTDEVKYVVKEVSMSKMRPREKEEARKECKVLSEMRHPNIISFVESFERGMKLYIVMDYADGGDLAAKISARRGRLFPEAQAMDWFVQICLAMKHVHDRKILHRDLKTQNIFLTSRNMIKLGDFGIAKRLRNTRELARTQIGTPYYFSPEICDGKPYNNKSDVWSLGVVLYELLTLKYPFDGRSMQQLVMKICRGNYKPVGSTYSTSLRGLVDQMLQNSQSKRPSVNGILKKPFIQKRISSFLGETLLKEEFSHTVIHGPKKRFGAQKPGNANIPSRRPSAADIRGAAARKPKARAEVVPASRRPSAAAARKPSVAKKAAVFKAPQVGRFAKQDASKRPSSSDAPKAQCRGKCGICGEPVMTDQDRTQDDKGVYFHICCLRKEREQQRQKELKEQKASEAAEREQKALQEAERRANEAAQRRQSEIAAAEQARSEKERAAKEEQDRYSAMLKQRHDEFIQRRREGLANKKRLQQHLRGVDAPNKLGWVGVDDRSPAPKAPAPVHHVARKPSPPPSATPVAESSAESARKAAVAEYNERQRRARANRAAAEADRNGSVPDAAIAAVEEPTKAIKPAEPPSRRPSQARKAWGKPDKKPVLLVDPTLGETVVVENPKTAASDLQPDATRVVRAEAEQPNDVVSDSRAKLREMIQQKRADAKKRGSPEDDLPVEHTDEEAPAIDTGVVKKDVPQDRSAVRGMLAALPILGDSLASTIGVVLDGQADEMISEGEDDAEETADATSGPRSDDAEPAATEEEEVDAKESQEDADYEAMLMHMSMSCGAMQAAKALASMANAARQAAPIEEIDDGSESDDSEFGDSAEEVNQGPESVFARMERVRTELEADLGFDMFFAAYKKLRDVFSVDDPPIAVPNEVRDAVLAELGEEGEQSYFRMIEMVKAENGIFE